MTSGEFFDDWTDNDEERHAAAWDTWVLGNSAQKASKGPISTSQLTNEQLQAQLAMEGDDIPVIDSDESPSPGYLTVHSELLGDIPTVPDKPVDVSFPMAEIVQRIREGRSLRRPIERIVTDEVMVNILRSQTPLMTKLGLEQAE